MQTNLPISVAKANKVTNYRWFRELQTNNFGKQATSIRPSIDIENGPWWVQGDQKDEDENYTCVIMMMMMLMTRVKARLPPPRVLPEQGYLTLRCKSEKVGSVRLYFRSAAPYHLKVGNWDSLFLLLWIIVMKSTFIVHCLDKNPNIGSLFSWSCYWSFFHPQIFGLFSFPTKYVYSGPSSPISSHLLAYQSWRSEGWLQRRTGRISSRANDSNWHGDVNLYKLCKHWMYNNM